MSDVYGSDLLEQFESQIGHALSGGYDMMNGYDHPWAYFCEAGVESTGRNCGLDVTPQGSATGAGLIAAVGGILRHDLPEHGGVIVFGPDFYYPYGHTGYWNEDRQQLLGTMTDGSGVAYTSWGPGTTGYAGLYRLPGVAGPRPGFAPDPPPANWLVQPNNPFSPDADGNEVGIGSGFLRFWNTVGIGLDPYVVLGFAMEREHDATVTDANRTARSRIVQAFERGTLIYQEGEPYPWDVVMALASQTIT
jgi:hypothetical protein